MAVRILADGFGLALLGFTTLLMLNSLIYSRRVSADTIVGGICVYLLLGLCFAMKFLLICDLAQMMSVAEAVIGPLYLAIFVARLVALYVAGDRRNPRLRGQRLIESND